MKVQPLELLHKTKLPVICRLKLERTYIKTIKKTKKLFGIQDDANLSFYPLVRNNQFYGDEELLRNYAGVKEDLYAIIEHGLYFGNNTSKVGNSFEWELGCILTSGDYRKELINREFPDYFCETIGPMIHYAAVDNGFKEDLRSKIDDKKRTMLFFPVHGNEYFTPEYDTEKTLLKILEIADKNLCYNIIVCVYNGNMELFKSVAEKLNHNRIIITTCGNRYDASFLGKQKAMIELSDLTISNNLGTHLGYCIYLGKPHILLPQSFSYIGDEAVIKADFGTDNRSENWKDDFEQEKALFQRIFHPGQSKITHEQWELCDFYWGYSRIKTPNEIKTIYEHCHNYAMNYINRGKNGNRYSSIESTKK